MTTTIKKVRAAQYCGNWKSGGGPRGRNDLVAVYAVTVDGVVRGNLRTDTGRSGGNWAVYDANDERISAYFGSFKEAKETLVKGEGWRR